MPFTTDTATPDAPETGRDIRQTYIEHTKGIWVRHNTTEHAIELWFDGGFVASWGEHIKEGHIHPEVAVAIMQECVKVGERKRAAAIKALLS